MLKHLKPWLTGGIICVLIYGITMGLLIAIGPLFDNSEGGWEIFKFYVLSNLPGFGLGYFLDWVNILDSLPLGHYASEITIMTGSALFYFVLGAVIGLIYSGITKLKIVAR